MIVGARNPWRMEAAIQRAMERVGHTTLLFDDRRSSRRFGRWMTQRRVLRTARKFQPDFIFLSKCLRLDLDTVEQLVAGRPNAMWYHDPQWHHDTTDPDIAHIAGVGRLAEVFFVTGFVEEWRARGLNAAFLPAAGAAEITPVAPDAAYTTTAAFIGTGYDQARAEFLMALSRRVPTRVYGPGWERWHHALQWNGGVVEGDDFARVCSSADFTLGILPANATGATTYASDRMWMTILAGGLYLGPWAEGLDQMLVGGEHCFWYRSLDDCVTQIEVLMARPSERQRVRAAGEAFVRRWHTYDARIANLLSRTPWQNPLEAGVVVRE